ncbi:hypothetical protein GCM10007290_11360 [Providencia stuartii]|uniref:Uncharacterized protein n=1 Tax=Providencia stuartii (strain MRSN 2154) TaxID=1157951 RepID=A0A140STD8_PROSM|nr:hypothetical protein S70_20680 [Providencia stuartii MRSN 2154]KNZ86922.1 hypothetical protein AFL46_06000 [Providencia stuartii]GHB87336.1 hypothetical protein GCM10007290_11360 [Providencia thailandensis]
MAISAIPTVFASGGAFISFAMLIVLISDKVQSSFLLSYIRLLLKNNSKQSLHVIFKGKHLVDTRQRSNYSTDTGGK